MPTSVAQLLPIESDSIRVFPLVEPNKRHIEGSSFAADSFSFPQGEKRSYYFRPSSYGFTGSSMVLDVLWYSGAGRTSGAVSWSAAVAAITPGDAQDVLTKALASSVTVTTTVSATSRGLNRTRITITNVDSLASQDYLTVALTRSTGDTMAGTAEVVGVSVTFDSTTEGLPPFVGDTTYYISAAGNDANDGLTTGTAWQTAARAWAERNRYGESRGRLYFQFLGASTFTLPLLGASVVGTGGSITFAGDTTAETVNATGIFLSTFAGGVATTTPGLGADGHRGRFLRVTSGAQAGAVYLLCRNTDTTVEVPRQPANNITIGDTFQIVTEGTTFSFSAAGSGQPIPAPTDWTGGAWSPLYANYPGHTFYACNFTNVAVFVRSVVGLVQCRTAGGLTAVASTIIGGEITNAVRFGVGADSATELLRLAGLSSQISGGAGYSVQSASSLNGVFYCGSAVTIGANRDAGDLLYCRGGRFQSTVTANGGAITFGSGVVRHQGSLISTRFGRVIIEQGHTATFVLTSGSCLRASYNGLIIINSVNVTGGTTAAAGFGSDCSDGGMIIWTNQAPTLTGGTAGADLKSTNTAAVANATLAANGQQYVGTLNDAVQRAA